MLKDRSADTIAAIATAMSSSGIGIIRVSGDDAISIVNRIFMSKREHFDLNTAPSHRILLWYDFMMEKKFWMRYW